MKSRSEQQACEAKKPRFKIEKLEERIAPAKGGIPGPGDGGSGGSNDDHDCRWGSSGPGGGKGGGRWCV